MSIGAAIGIEAANMALDYGFNLLTRKQQMRDQKELIDYQQDKQIDFWNMQNAYNDPSAQVSRLRAAGLNPAMLNGNSVNNTAGGLSSIGAPSAPSGSSRQASIGASMQMLSQLLSDEKARGFMDAQTAKLGEEVLNLQLERDIKEIAKALGMTEREVRELERTALYEAYYGVGLDGGEPTIRNNPYVKQMEEVDARRLAAESSARLNDALTITEDLLRPERLAQLEQNISESRARVSNLDADTKRLLRESESLEQIIDRREIQDCASAFYGFPVHDLPSALQSALIRDWRSVVRGDLTPQQAMDGAVNALRAYQRKEHHIPRSSSRSSSIGGDVGVTGLGFNSSSSWSELY